MHVVLDLSGRPHLSCDLAFPTERIGSYETQLVEHFFQSLVNTSGMTLHIRQVGWGAEGRSCLPAVGLLLVPGCWPGAGLALAARCLARLMVAAGRRPHCTTAAPSACLSDPAPSHWPFCPPALLLCPCCEQLGGKNSHHIVEATFKAFARALRHATETDPRRAGTVASSKGVLTQQ